MSIQGRNLSDNPVSTEYFDALEANDDSSIITGLPRFSTVTSGIANVTSPVILQSSGQDSLLENLIIPLYGTIFFLSIVGNSLVLITLARNKRMRTVTNVYLLNLVSLCILLDSYYKKKAAVFHEVVDSLVIWLFVEDTFVKKSYKWNVGSYTHTHLKNKLFYFLYI